MNMFYRRSISEYERQIGLKQSFELQTERIQQILETFDWTPFETAARRARAEQNLPPLPPLELLLLFPLLEIAWADGSVSRREADAILQTARNYGLTRAENSYCELLERLTTRPLPPTVAQMWRDFRCLLENLPEYERENVAFCLDVQTRFVAEQSSDNLLALLRGERVSKRENEALEAFERHLDEAQTAARRRAEQAEVERHAAAPPTARAATERRAFEARTAAGIGGDIYAEFDSTLEEYSALVPLVPLVKTAWAEGRVTKRERQLIFEAADRMGVKPGSAAHRRLGEWLELHPTDEFYDHSLDVLQQRLDRLDADEKTKRRADLLGDCARVAEASGGSRDFAAGGAKICDEEFVAVKHIARRLSGAAV